MLLCESWRSVPRTVREWLIDIFIKWRYYPRTCWTILSNCLMNLKNSGDSTGFEPMTSAMLVQCSNQLRYEVTQLRADQFVGLMFSGERNVVWHFTGKHEPNKLICSQSILFECSIQNVTIIRLTFTCSVFFFFWQIILSGMRPNRSFLSVIMHIRRATPILHSHHLSQKVSEPLTMLSEEEEMMRDTGEL